MAVSHDYLSFTAIAGATLVKGYAVKFDATNGKVVVVATSGEPPVGIVGGAAASGAAVAIIYAGTAKAVAGSGGVTEGDLLKAGTDGRLVTAIGAHVDTSSGTDEPVVGSYVIGMALETAAVGVEFEMAVFHAGAVPATTE